MPLRTLTALAALLIVCAGCGGAVRFAPTPTPPDESPRRYDHPSGAFSIRLPPGWTVYAQNTSTLAAAAFYAPGQDSPTLTVAVVNLGQETPIAALINRYQTELRPDADRYVEVDRQAMGDGSWRLSGLRRTIAGPEALNTFLQQAGALVGVLEVTIPGDDSIALAELETVANTFALNPGTPLQIGEAANLSAAARADLEIVNVTTWQTAGGVFFITGEVINHTPRVLADVPVRAALFSAEGTGLVDAIDAAMGYALPPGGYTPFSLRFGLGQPPEATTYTITVGAADWVPVDAIGIVGAESLNWSDASAITPEGYLLVEGTLTNTGPEPVRAPQAVITVFDDQQNVIAAGFSVITEDSLAPGESIAYGILITEMGGDPANYIINIQARS